ncbi:MAG TPA: hypothetical protein VN455_03420 [Methanotrichaceae archaeon]|nr:hypothetical protein [Methanotrichaceae archaeon]
MAGKTHKSNLELMAEAERIVKPQYPTAVQVEDHGIPSSGLAKTAGDVDHWRFIFTDIDDICTITLDYFNGQFGKPARSPTPWKETAIRELPRHMSLDDAVLFLRDAGYSEPFKSVTLRASLPTQKGADASYIFTLDKRVVFMNAVTGEVTQVVEQE